MSLKEALFIFAAGMTMGGLMAISIRYPVKVASVEEASALCVGPNVGLERLKVGISGKMYYVKCKNGKEFKFK